MKETIEPRLSSQVERIEVPDMAPVFAPDGAIARVLGERYRHRKGQVEMAQLVRRALIEARPLLVEAGTGCGKSFAYLAPLIWSGASALVSTANKTLQTQLWEKDIPALQQVAPRPFAAALLKGRANYVCRLKLRAVRPQLALPGADDGLADLFERLGSIRSGDVEELRLPAWVREEVTAGEHECLGRDCLFFSRCYYEQAKLRAEEADIVVVNHALLAFNLIQPFLTPRPVVVVDEAHELERYAVNALRVRLGYTTVPGLINDELVIRHVADRLRGEAAQVNHQLFEQLAGQPARGESRWSIEGHLAHARTLADRIGEVSRQLLNAYAPLPGAEDDEESVRHQIAIQWAETLAAEIAELTDEPPPERVRYGEKAFGASDLERIALCVEPVEIDGFVRESLFQSIPRVICTGATLTVGGRFDYFRRRLGAPANALESVIDSPFDYARQALLYTPGGLEPRYGEGEEDYVLELGRTVWRLIRASRGRAFVLCTSARRMNELYELVSPHLEYPCYCQGSGLSRAELLESFQNDPDGAVLFATRSFWEGVDVPGEVLSLVIIDKLPFSPQFDPVVAHRQQRIRDRGGNPFDEMTLPEAILTLKQGVGRLIRTETDRGVVAILDSRVNSKRYGRQVVASLPGARRTGRIADVRAFFDEE